LIDLAGLAKRDPIADFEAVNIELERFEPTLAERPQIVVGNKIDLAESRANLSRIVGALRSRGVELLTISAATGEGIAELVSLLCETVERSIARRLLASRESPS
jgi:GTP-binding protein